MKVLKGLAAGILSFLLFLSLATFGFVFTLNRTVLSPDFVVSEVDKIDMPQLAKEIAEQQLGGQLTSETQLLKEAVYQVISDQEPWLKEQINVSIHTAYDFLLGKSGSLRLTISLEPLKAALKDTLRNVFMKSLPPQIASLPPAQIEQYFNQYYQQFAAQIPSELQLDESQIPPEAMKQLLQARQIIGYFQTGFYALIGFMLLLLLCIILIERNVRKTTRGLGVNFSLYGALEFAGIFVTKNFLPKDFTLPGLPPSLQPWLLVTANDLLMPLQTFSLGLLIVGIVLIVVSFIFKPSLTEE